MIKKYSEKLEQLNAQIWDYSEIRFAEHRSVEALTGLLKDEGFDIVTGLADIDTAFTATWGKGKPVIGFLAEYDALSGMSQEAFLDVKKPIEGSPNGHGCGHSLLGSASVGAALLLRDYLKENNKEGTVVLVGCPAEEGGSAKAYLARAGVFDPLDIALTWHPGTSHAVMVGSLQANCQVYYRFKGISAHAAASPHLGRSALDSVELMNMGVNYMREHMEDCDRVHYAVTDTGGTSPNVVQSHAEVLYLIRSINNEKVKKLYERVNNIARGAALMNETEVEIIFDKACSNVMSNSVLEALLYESLQAIPLPTYTEEEIAFANKMKKTVNIDDMRNDLSMLPQSEAMKANVIERLRDQPMANFVMPYEYKEINIPGSSDVGDCSHCVPTAQISAACFVPGTALHSWQAVSQGKAGIAVKGMLYAAEVMADAAKRAVDNPDYIARAKAEFERATGGKKYECPIPPEVKPNMNKR
jgi:aminobenzoyl-glutamate utilization protein B